ncbi:hypothetical protein GOP47_0025838 [Adiantum capillus-veneris]|uniref:Uncharacterized protein n=1 Tax=Adiantum capillus-veneris TaxID=13818 RepID=A0A9D4U2U0_ADICA|nr:hypothetical protein GOP47_0025838 [Adiantum capillus-veneris]
MASAYGSRHRSNSPFGRGLHKSVDGHLPGYSNYTPSFYSAAVAGSNLPPPTGSTRGRSLTPTRVRSMTPPTFKFKFGSPSSRNTIPLSSSVMDFPHLSHQQPVEDNGKENVLVTVRFRPLSMREIQRGDEVAWYADGETTVRSEYNPATAYAFDRVFGPATTTRAVYDVAARQVVRGAMEGVNGTVFAYGVTSSGKTHTMHGDQKSPGIIPLAVKDVFSIIQDTPGREYLLRVSYLEIYNEVINDLLDLAGQNLRIREDAQGTYVEGVKEEVVLSPAHALSLIAAGEEHRHVGSNNFNLLSSRSHTIFTLTIESSSRTGDCYDDEVTLSQLNLIDLAGSESSKTETTGLRRKEGSYINKSLLTLGTVIGKLSDLKASHVPFRDSKLTRLLQSSLSGHGRVSLICTLTPASSNLEETHNTLKFAHRAKRVAIYAAPNRIMDEKSLIKKYQKEISLLKHELDQLRRGMFDKPYLAGTAQEDLLSLRQQLEAGQVKLQSRLEEEEQAKAALLGRIQRLTKLILVSTKNSTLSQEPERQGQRRRHSFGEEDLKSLGEKRPAFALDFEDDGGSVSQDLESSFDGKIDGEEIAKEDKKSKRRGMLGWFKLRRNGSFNPTMSLDAEISPNASPASAGSNTPHCESMSESRGRRRSFSRKADEVTPMIESFPQFTQAGELFSATMHYRRPPPSGETVADQMDLLREQVKMLTGEVALCTSSLKRMSEQAIVNGGDDTQLQAQMERTKNEIQEKRRQIQVLEKRIVEAGKAALNNASPVELSETMSKLMGQLNEKEFELELKTADNRILQEQLQTRMSEIKELQDTIAAMQQKSFVPGRGLQQRVNGYLDASHSNGARVNQISFSGDDMDADMLDDLESSRLRGNLRDTISISSLQGQVLKQASEIEKLQQEKDILVEEKEGLQIQGQKLAEEASYAKELASAAAVELKNLAEEVKKLSLQNSQLAADLVTMQEAAFSRLSSINCVTNGSYVKGHARSDRQTSGCQTFRVNDGERVFVDLDNEYTDFDSWELDPEDMKRELHARKEREVGLEAALAEKEQVEADLRKKLEDAKQREANLENDLAGMWVVVAKLKKERGTSDEPLEMEVDDSSQKDSGNETVNSNGFHDNSQEKMQKKNSIEKEPDKQQKMIEELQMSLENEKLKTTELQSAVSRLKGDDLDSLHYSTLEDLQNLHMEALTKICQAKARNRDLDREKERGLYPNLDQHHEESNGHICKVCFEAPTAAVLLPCRHFCLCKPCAVACTECPLCRSGIADRIITFTS